MTHTITPQTAPPRRRWDSPVRAQRAIQAIGAAELTYGLSFFALLLTGFVDATTGAVVALGVVVGSLVGIGGAAIARARRVAQSVVAGTTAVTANAILTVTGVALPVGGCQSFSAATGMLVLGVVAAGALSAVTIAVAREIV
ncbi:hypothetical protein NN3_13070 [Nocardia neocaledoniensis NBRC 108232]|uniref:Uncharacterized protein n=1 Tax=Nocardia neocaledoniensis TaxID=236511 RepID=A0A317N7K2_9NOCA|nr:hypothetical protein [Nocardia neocaledoniensis]PWV71034.1 hypothetical protein DFR69_11123 [Nocardia neocaledoniensis]GEM30300.1 hypothetical protein NN3_13070 [Nocardia neocaledoniensis NBRC 108232]